MFFSPPPRWICLMFVLYLVTSANVRAEFRECGVKIDIVFVLDGSSSVQKSNFDKMIQSLTHFIDVVLASDNITFNVGVVLFSTSVTESINLSANADALKKQVLAFSYPNEATRTDAGIEAARLIFQNSARKNGFRIMIVITAGLSQDPGKTEQKAKLAKDAGISVFVVGINVNGVNKTDMLTELERIASSSDLVTELTEFNDLEDVVMLLPDPVCNQLLKPLHNVSISAGKDILLEAEYSHKGVEATWFFQGQQILDGGRYDVSVVNGTRHRLTVKRATSRDTGLYKVNIGKINSQAYVTVIVCGLQIDIVFVLDGSSSVQKTNFNLMLQSLVNFLDVISSNNNKIIHVGVVLYSSSVTATINLSDDVISLKTQVLALTFPGGKTRTDVGINAAMEIFQNSGRKDGLRIMIVITNGMSEYRTMTLTAATKAKNKNINIFVVGVNQYTSDVNKTAMQMELERIASSTDLVTELTEFSDVEDVVEQLPAPVCNKLVRGLQNVSVSARKDIVLEAEYGFSGLSATWYFKGKKITEGSRISVSSNSTRYRLLIKDASRADSGEYTIDIDQIKSTAYVTVVVCGLQIDIVFVLDGSSTVQKKNFDLMIQSLMNFVQFASTNDNSIIHIGIVLYSSTVTTTINLSNDISELKREIQALRYPSAGTRTDKGIETAENIFQNSGRKNAIRIMIVITNGLSDDRQTTFAAATKAKNKNINIFVVGVNQYTSDVNKTAMQTELERIASSPDFVTELTEFSDMEDVVMQLPAPVCSLFVTPLRNMNVASGQDVVLEAEYTVERATATWFFQGQKVSDDRQHTVNVIGTRHRLVVKDTNKWNTGVYTVNIGQTNSTAVVTVVECHQNTDIVFVVDGSFGVTHTHFKLMTASLLRFTELLLGSRHSGVRVGMVLYSSNVASSISLSNNFTALKKQILALKYPNEATRTDKGIEAARQIFKKSGSDENYHVMVVITVGNSQYPNNTLATAINVKKTGINIVVVCINEEKKLAVMTELLSVASSPELFIELSQFSEFEETVLQLPPRICGGVLTHPCNRECIKGEKPKTCLYHFTPEWYLTLSKACYDCPFNLTDCYRPDCVSADGLMRPLITVNRQMPGPPIEVCENDRIIVWVDNHLDDGEATSVHWHGIHQVGTPYMDGLAHVTQCPIGEKEKFKYEFTASPAGTHWYHSHTGIQLADGLNGAFVVRQPKELDPNSILYDYDLSEHIVVVNDWMTTFHTAMSQYVFLMHDLYDAGQMSGLINGRRRHYNVSTRNVIESNRTHAQTPMEVFHVEQNKRYRFRFVGAMSNCPFTFSVDKHRLTVIAMDGAPVEPKVVDSFIMHSGERYDFVLNADQSVGNYWLKAIGLGDCYKQKLSVTAVIRYKGAPDEDPPGEEGYVHKSGIMLNPLISDGKKEFYREYGYNHTWMLVHELRHAGKRTDYTDEKVDMKLYIGMDFDNNDNTIFNKKDLYPAPFFPSMKAHFTPTLDNITFKLPPIPILSQPEDVDQSWFCNRSAMADPDACLRDLCLCTHLIRLPKDAVVELVVFNIGTYFDESGHPMHIHGYNYRVLGNAKVDNVLTRQRVMDMDREGKLIRNFINPPLRDTIHILDGGYAIIRFKADNPGLWFFHCHTDSHLLQGKALVFMVGEYSDFPPVPDPFPRCGGFGFSNARRPVKSDNTNGVPVSSAGKTLVAVLISLCFFFL